MDCSDTQKRLARRSVGLLDSNLKQEMESHLASCEECRREANRLDEVMKLVESVPPHEPPYGLWLGIEKNITKAEKTSPFPRFFKTGWAWAGTTAVLTAGILFFSGIHFHSNQQPQIQMQAMHSDQIPLIHYASMESNEPLSDRVAMGTLAEMAGDEESSK